MKMKDKETCKEGMSLHDSDFKGRKIRVCRPTYKSKDQTNKGKNPGKVSYVTINYH